MVTLCAYIDPEQHILNTELCFNQSVNNFVSLHYNELSEQSRLNKESTISYIIQYTNKIYKLNVHEQRGVCFEFSIV